MKPRSYEAQHAQECYSKAATAPWYECRGRQAVPEHAANLRAEAVLNGWSVQPLQCCLPKHYCRAELAETC